MARKIIWSLPALQDLNDIYHYIKRDSVYYADKLIDEVIDKVDTLLDMPFRGRIIPELTDESIREIFIKQYRVIYKTTSDSITIHGVIHMARDFQTLWEQEKRAD
jgi:plasmid stabilization system protein ParE